MAAGRLKSLLMISPHFPPDSAAGTHRARVLAPHLAAHGWQPVVLTVEPSSVDGELDPELSRRVAADLRVVRVAAWPSATTRRVGFGDLGLRAYRPLRRAAFALALRESFDATLVTTYPTYPALIGTALKRAVKVPFVLDLQDPWVGAWGKTVGPGGRPDVRSRLSRALATCLERRAARAADALMSVTSRTIEDLVDRVPSTAATPRLELPIGWEPADWLHVRAERRANGLFDPLDGNIHVCAVGTVLPTALDGVRALLEAVSAVVATAPAGNRLRVWFVGTSNERRTAAPPVVTPMATQYGVSHVVREHPARLSYFDALRVMRDAHAVLVIGSGEPHYTPSRVFPALASRRPVIARLHRASPAHRLLQDASTKRPIALIDWSADPGGQRAGLTQALLETLQRGRADDGADDGVLTAFTGDALARQVATLLDRVVRK